jgi:Uma2 family endonuclease
MASLPNANTVTYEEWLRMPEVRGAKEEVVNGEIRIMPAPLWDHLEVVQNLYDSIRPQVDKSAVMVTSSLFNLIVRRQPLTTREPDLAVFHRSTIVKRDGRIHSAPQLIVEVLSPANTRREREEKLADYESLGVPELWEVTPGSRTIEVLYLEDGKLRRHAILTEGVLTPRHFPDVQVRIDEIWPD